MHVHLRAQDRFSQDYSEYQGLDGIARRLRSLTTTHGAIVNAYHVSPWLELFNKLEHALQELHKGCVIYDKLADAKPLAHEVLQGIETHLATVQQSCQTLSTLQENFHFTQIGLMTTGLSASHFQNSLT